MNVLDGWLETLKAGKWKWFRRNWGKTLAFCGVVLVLTAVLKPYMSFISSSPNDESEDELVRWYFAFGGGFLLTFSVFYCYFERSRKMNLLKDALLILQYFDPNVIKKIDLPDYSWDYQYREYFPGRDIVSGIVLQAMGIPYWHDWSELKRILEKAKAKHCIQWEQFIPRLNLLIDDELEDRIKRKYPKQVFFLRLNLLSCFARASFQGKWLVFDCPEKLLTEKVLNVVTWDSPERVIIDFYKIVLTKYYSYCPKYPAGTFSDFDLRAFRKRFSDVAQIDQGYHDSDRVLRDWARKSEDEWWDREDDNAKPVNQPSYDREDCLLVQRVF